MCPVVHDTKKLHGTEQNGQKAEGNREKGYDVQAEPSV